MRPATADLVVATVQFSISFLKKLHPALAALAMTEGLERYIAVLPPWNKVVNDDVNWQTMLIHLDAVDAFLVHLLLLEQPHDALGLNSKFSQGSQKIGVSQRSLFNVLRIDFENQSQP